jgi:hypothetical protein
MTRIYVYSSERERRNMYRIFVSFRNEKGDENIEINYVRF